MRFLLPLLFATVVISAAEQEESFPRQAEVAQALREHLAPHPRLFWSAADQAALPARLAADPALAAAETQVLRDAETHLADPIPVRELAGQRLLGVSQACMKRLVLSAYAWRRTADPRYLSRVRADLTAVLGFSDWNPKHFLDVAVLAHGVAVAYDWCYDALPVEERAAIRAGLLTKAIAPSRGRPWWLRVEHNWNQVCHGGLSLAALAMAEDTPTESAWVLGRAIDCLPKVMATYGPDGAYAEGPSYWAFGTTYNVLLLDGLTTSLGTDFGLSETPGFIKTGEYFQHVSGPTGNYFLYSDCVPHTAPVPAQAWFAARAGDPSLLWNEARWMERLATRQETNTGSVWNPDAVMYPVWASRLPNAPTMPVTTHWAGRGAVPSAYHRSDWTPEATWVAIKGGTPRSNHGHMDVGSFAMESQGVRWADDLGMQEYLSLEKAGLKIWEMGATSQRWAVYRLGSLSHNILTVDGQPQSLQGRSEILRHTADRTVVDLSPAYTGQLATATRGIALLADRSVVIEDNVTALGQPATVRWAMLTRAEVRLQGGEAILTQAGQSLALRVLEPAGTTLETYSTEPPAAYDAPNPGTCQIGFKVPLEAGASAVLRVVLVPGAGPTGATLPGSGLASW